MKKFRTLTNTEIQFARLRLEKIVKMASKSEINMSRGHSVDRSGVLNNDEGDDVAESTRQVDKLISSLRCLDETNWREVNYGDIRSHFRKENIGKPLKIRGSIKCLSNLSPCCELHNTPDKLELDISDSAGECTKVFPVINESLITKIQGLFDGHQSLDFLGTVIPDGGDGKKVKPAYKFYLFNVETSDDPLQIVQASAHDIDEARKLVEELAQTPGAILEHIKKTLIDTIGIKGLDSAPDLDRSLEFMVLQALSDGYDPSRSLSHKLHSLIVGSPAVGKKLLTQAAHILNPVCTEGQPAKLTVPGISGIAVNRDGRWTSEPGLIPLAHRGTFVVQDFHHVAKKEPLMGVLSLVMEDGKVIDSTAAKKIHHALTSIHIDLNRQSHVLLDGQKSTESPRERLADLGVKMNVLTRFDYIAEIPRDTVRQLNIALKMHSGGQATSKYPEQGKSSDEARKLQVLVAYLRTTHEKIEIPSDVCENYIRPKHEELLEKNHDTLARLSLLGDYQTRLSNSIHKLIFAIARGNARKVATEADVDEAFKYVATKLKFLSQLEHFEVPESWSERAEANRDSKRLQFISERFGGGEVTVKEVHMAVVKEFVDVSESTIRRDLSKVGSRKKHGVFVIDKPKILPPTE